MTARDHAVPCGKSGHAGHGWYLPPAGRTICGLCHPPSTDDAVWLRHLAPATAVETAPSPTASRGGDLAECERIIERGLATFLEVGTALLRIRDGRLYRETHGTFEDYCRERWGFSRRNGYDLMRTAEVSSAVQDLAHEPPTPPRESARELAPLRDQPDAMGEVWTEAVNRHGPRPTARQVREVVQEREPQRNGASDGARAAEHERKREPSAATPGRRSCVDRSDSAHQRRLALLREAERDTGLRPDAAYAEAVIARLEERAAERPEAAHAASLEALRAAVLDTAGIAVAVLLGIEEGDEAKATAARCAMTDAANTWGPVTAALDATRRRP